MNSTVQHSSGMVFFRFNGCHHSAMAAAVVDGKFVPGWRLSIQHAATNVDLPVPEDFAFERVHFAELDRARDGAKLLRVSVIYPDAWEYTHAKLKEAGYESVILDDSSEPNPPFVNIFSREQREGFHQLGFHTQFLVKDSEISEVAYKGVDLKGHAVTAQDTVEYFNSIGIPARLAWTGMDFDDMYARVEPQTLEQAGRVVLFQERFGKLADRGIHVLQFGDSWRGGERKIFAKVEGLVTFANKNTLDNVGAQSEEDLYLKRFWARVTVHQTKRGTKVGTAHLIAPFTGLGNIPAE